MAVQTNEGRGMDKGLILIVEDEPRIAEILEAYLVREGFRTVTAANGDIALSHHAMLSPDLVLLDVHIPRLDGFEVLARIRQDSATPVIMVTALAEDIDRLSGLRLGADDYVVKPFSVRELLARVEAILRRAPERPREIAEIPIPGGAVCLGRGEARFEDGTRCELSEREIELLRYLASHSGRAVSRDELMASLTRRKIGVGVHYRACHLHPYYRDRYHLAPERFPVATDISERTLSLPLSPDLTEDDLLKVKNVGEKALAEIGELLRSEDLNFGMTFTEQDGELVVAGEGTRPTTPPVSPEEMD